MDSTALVELLLSALGVVVTGVGAWFVFEFREMRKSVENLNVALAKILDRVESHDERISRLEEFNYQRPDP